MCHVACLFYIQRDRLYTDVDFTDAVLILTQVEARITILKHCTRFLGSSRGVLVQGLLEDLKRAARVAFRPKKVLVVGPHAGQVGEDAHPFKPPCCTPELVFDQDGAEFGVHTLCDDACDSSIFYMERSD